MYSTNMDYQYDSFYFIPIVYHFSFISMAPDAGLDSDDPQLKLLSDNGIW